MHIANIYFTCKLPFTSVFFAHAVLNQVKWTTVIQSLGPPIQVLQVSFKLVLVFNVMYVYIQHM